MPPKPKFTREQVLEAALEIVRTQGESALTARRLGQELGASPRPIFTLFDSMEEVKTALLPLTDQVFYSFCADFDDFTPAYKKIGMSTVAFSQVETNLFAFMFMSKHSETLTLNDWVQGRIGEEAVAILMRDYGFDRQLASEFHKEMWVHAFSLCVLRAGDVVSMSNQEVSDSLTRAFTGLYSLAKSGHFYDRGVTPVKGQALDELNMKEVPLVPILDPSKQ